MQFARHGIPDVLITDNGTQFSSSEFAKFAEVWKFEHKTSSPHHPQSNGKVENAVKICKNLLKKARADNRDPLLAFLDWRNTPTEGLGTSPVQRLMGRRTRTLLPTHTKLLKSQLDSETEAKLAQPKQKQELQYNKKSQTLPPIQPGQAIRMKLPGNTKWSLGSCVKALPNRSYEVEVTGRRYHCNRCQLRMAETPPHTTLEDLPNNDADVTSPVNSQETTQPTRCQDDTSGVTPEPVTQPRRSTRVRKPPAWHNDYLMNY